MDEENYKKEIQKYLKKLSELAVCQLMIFQNYNFHPKVKLIDVEVFSDGFGEELPVRFFLIDEFNCEVFHEDKNYFPLSSIGLLEYVKLSKWEVKSDLENDIELITEAIIVWFIECWQKAGGQLFKLPAYIGQHDDSMTFNLKTLEWNDEKNDKWKYFSI